jgi:hypothetical protein
VLITASLALLTYTVSEANRYGWLSPRTVGLGGVSLALLAAFLTIEARLQTPLIPLSILKVRSLSVSATVTFLIVAGLYSTFYLGSLYQQVVKGHSPLVAGLMFLPQSFCVAAFSAVSQRLMARVTPKRILTVGLLLNAAGLAYLAQLRVTDSYAGGFLPGLVCVAAGLGLSFVPLTLIATSDEAEADQGLASGVFNTSQQVGGAVGLSVLAAIASAVTTHARGSSHAAALVSGYTTAFAVATGVTLTAFIVATAFLPARKTPGPSGSGELADARDTPSQRPIAGEPVFSRRLEEG